MGYTYGTSRKALRPTTPDQEQPKPKFAPVVQAKPEPAPKPVRQLQPCGTNAAYVRHFKRYENPCAACTKARREYVAEQRKSPTRRRAEAKCGTYSGAIRHYRNHETPCDPCTEARRQYAGQRNHKKKFATEAQKAYEAAMRAHPENTTEGPRRLDIINRARHQKVAA